MVKAVFPGSFDPPTHGHLNIIDRAAEIFEEILVVIAVNPAKKTFFTPEERLDLMEKLLADYSNVSIHLCDSLVVDFAQEMNAKVLLRGIRGMSDFSYEFDLSIINKSLNKGIETLFMPTDPKYFVLRSSAIKDILLFNGNISSMVPRLVEEALRAKL
jgi:pantetheine-phosphate adenylyltransferase